MMEETGYKDNEKVLYKTRCKLILPKEKPGEVDCFVTEDHMIIETGERIKIALSYIRECNEKEPEHLYDLPVYDFSAEPSEPLSSTAEVIFLDDSGKNHKLALEMTTKEFPYFRRAIYGQIVGRFVHEASEFSSNTTLGKFFSATKETFRDKTRDNICAGLQSLGVKAVLGERGQLEEKIGGIGGISDIGSLGIVHVSGSPIRWINVRKEKALSSDRSPTYYYYTEYGVPDPRLGFDSHRIQINTVRVKSVPLVGKVVDLRWEGWDSDSGIIDRLNSNDRVKQPIMESRDVTIRAVNECGCWIISTGVTDTFSSTQLVTSTELWDCYETIAEHLLAGRAPR